MAPNARRKIFFILNLKLKNLEYNNLWVDENLEDFLFLFIFIFKGRINHTLKDYMQKCWGFSITFPKKQENILLFCLDAALKNQIGLKLFWNQCVFLFLPSLPEAARHGTVCLSEFQRINSPPTDSHAFISSLIYPGEVDVSFMCFAICYCHIV